MICRDQVFNHQTYVLVTPSASIKEFDSFFFFDVGALVRAHWALGIGHWAWGMGHGAHVARMHALFSLFSLFILGRATT